MNLLSPTIKKKISVAAILTCLFFLPSTTKAYTINSVHGNLTYCDTMTRGIFIIWWDNDFNCSAKANVALDSMLAFRNTCLNNLGMQDPLNAKMVITAIYTFTHQEIRLTFSLLIFLLGEMVLEEM